MQLLDCELMFYTLTSLNAPSTSVVEELSFRLHNQALHNVKSTKIGITSRIFCIPPINHHIHQLAIKKLWLTQKSSKLILQPIHLNQKTNKVPEITKKKVVGTKKHPIDVEDVQKKIFLIKRMILDMNRKKYKKDF